MIENMKDSGVEWIGEIPESWNILPLGNCFTERNEKVSDYDWEPLSVTKQGILKQLESAAKSDAHDARKKVCKNDFVINSRSDRKQSCGVSPYDGSVSLINIVLENRFLNPDYVKYLLNNYGFAEEFYRWGTGIVADLWSTKWERMKKIMLPIPPVEVQSKIAKKLDDEIFKIDERITLTKQIIEDYKKYKQSVITEAVTKGLNPDVEMKDSGIEWIGEIPEHWKITSTKRLFELVAGSTPRSEVAEYWDGDIIWITPADYKTVDKYVQNGRRNITEEGMKSCSTSIIPENSIIFSKRAPVGSVAINTVPLCTNQGCISCVPKENANPVFYYYLMSIFTEQYELFSSGTTFKEISATNFGDFKVVLPYIDEQQKIVEFLDKKVKEIDNLISAKEQLIADMESYKKSLIYEYVTGKKEVSDNE